MNFGSSQVRNYCIIYKISCMNASLGLLESCEKVVISDKGSGRTMKKHGQS